MPIHYLSVGTCQGPVIKSEFERMIRDGRATPDTPVWRDGMSDWVPWSEFVALGGLFPPVIPDVGPTDEKPHCQLAAVPEGKTRCLRCHQVYNEEQVSLYAAGALCADCKAVLVDYVVQLDTGPLRGMSATSPPHARFGIRLWARILDGLVIIGVVLLVTAAFVLWSFVTAGPSTREAARNIGANIGGMVGTLTGTLWFLAFEPAMLWRFGATPGKRATGLRVVTEDGGPLPLATAFGRTAAPNIISMIPVIGFPIYFMTLAGCIAAAFDPLKRGVHDRVFQTRVIVVPQKSKRYRDYP